MRRQSIFSHSIHLNINANDSVFEIVFVSEYTDILK